jgi:hypothetical protein
MVFFRPIMWTNFVFAWPRANKLWLLELLYPFLSSSITKLKVPPFIDWFLLCTGRRIVARAQQFYGVPRLHAILLVLWSGPGSLCCLVKKVVHSVAFSRGHAYILTIVLTANNHLFTRPTHHYVQDHKKISREHQASGIPPNYVLSL